MKCPECQHVFRGHQLYAVNKEGKGRYIRTCPRCLSTFDEGKKNTGPSTKGLKADNARLTDLVTRFDTALRAIATESGMTEAYGGVDTKESLENFVKAIRALAADAKGYRKIGYDVFEVNEFYEDNN